jgi:hypothetical protein
MLILEHLKKFKVQNLEFGPDKYRGGMLLTLNLKQQTYELYQQNASR